MVSEKLGQLGFKQVGIFSLGDKGLDFQLFNSQDDEGVYIFLIDGEIRYIGKIEMALKQRMHGYKNPGVTQRTNQRINPKLLDVLKKGKKAEIWFKQYSTLEKKMIREFNPEWNQQLKGD